MKVLALRADAGGCAFYRIQEPCRVLEQYGWDIEIATDLPVEAVQDTKTKEIVVKDVTWNGDLIIFQRPLDHAFVQTIKLAQAKGIKCIVELDDDFESVSPDNFVYHDMQPVSSPLSNRVWLRRAATAADLVTASTPAIAKRYGPKSVVLRNYVPESVFDESYPRREGGVRVGWSGTVITHPHDLQQTAGQIGEVLKQTGASFTVVGAGELVRERLKLDKDTHVEATGWIERDIYFEALLKGFDIGIVPLERTPFNEAKSYLKGLEFAACGIPFVSTPLPEYRFLADHGIGQVAKSPHDWYRKVSHLIENDDYRLERGAAYRERARESFTYEQNAEQWDKAWRKVFR